MSIQEKADKGWGKRKKTLNLNLNLLASKYCMFEGMNREVYQKSYDSGLPKQKKSCTGSSQHFN
jgi:hypothetical protein